MANAKTVELNGEEVPRWISGEQAGYNPSSKKWHDRDGRFVSRERALQVPREWGRVIRPTRSFTPASDAAEKLEYIIAGIDPNLIAAAEKQTDPMPGAVLGMMRLAEFYCQTEGDVFQTIEAPLDIALKPLEIQSPDKGFQDALEELYSERHIDMLQNLYYIWLCSSIYGQAFPLEIIEDPVEDTRIVLIPPKNVEVGRSFSLHGRMSVKSPSGNGWTDQLLETAFPPMVYNRYVEDWNEAAAQGHDIPIPQEDCFPVREKSLPFQRYAIPPIYRASRALSTRRIFEEMRRATVEGVKNQLWYFRYGDPKGENMPLPEEIGFLGDAVEGLYGERTGVLVWEGRLAVEVIGPQAPDKLMANETYVGLTAEVFRKLGVSLKIVSGEHGPLGGASRSGDMDLDVSILLERVKFKVAQMYRWERRFRARLAEQMGKEAVKANEETIVSFGRIGIEVERLIKERLMPAYSAGVMSAQTFLQDAGYDYEVELQRKKDEESDRHLFMPPATFSQVTVGPGGDPQKEVSQTQPKGRPPEGSKPTTPKVEGHFVEAAANFASYVREAYDAFDAIEETGVEVFIANLKEINARRMIEFAVDGYLAGGGSFQIDEDWVNEAIAFVNSYADGFGRRLSAVEDPGSLSWNVYLYPQEGRHLAYMYGMQQAMREKGARAWKRVIHPELSKTGPCDECLADSRIIHPITEGFFEFNPNGVCSAQGVAYYTSPTDVMVEIPVPEKRFDPGHILEILKDFAQTLGKPFQRIVRRIRGD